MAVCSIMYQLATRPEEQEKIYEELMRIVPDSSVPLTTKDLDQANYMKAFIKEVFRYTSRCALLQSKLLSNQHKARISLSSIKNDYNRPLVICLRTGCTQPSLGTEGRSRTTRLSAGIAYPKE